jgi:nitrite reductase/ring-hydroxylating ferredoxin subunit
MITSIPIFIDESTLINREQKMGSIIGKLTDFPKGSIKEVTVQGKPYAISNIDGLLFAIDGRCGHAGGILSNDRLVGKVATCPKHGAEYDVTTGKNLKKPRIPFAKAPDLRSYKVTIDGENVILEI